MSMSPLYGLEKGVSTGEERLQRQKQYLDERKMHKEPSVKSGSSTKKSLTKQPKVKKLNVQKEQRTATLAPNAKETGTLKAAGMSTLHLPSFVNTFTMPASATNIDASPVLPSVTYGKPFVAKLNPCNIDLIQ